MPGRPYRESALPDPARSGQRHKPHALPNTRSSTAATPRSWPAAAWPALEQPRPAPRRSWRLHQAGHLEPLAQQHGQVVLDQVRQLRQIGEMLIGDATGIPVPGQHLAQPRLTVRRQAT